VTQELVLGIYVFVMAIFVGFEVISRVPSVLHTPLMSGTNAIHGIVVLGAFLVAGSADTLLLKALGFIAVVFGAANVFGGFVVTDRMLEMFKRRQPAESDQGEKKSA
jgi:NAD(P) transhydrogenase subunit alpha